MATVPTQAGGKPAAEIGKLLGASSKGRSEGADVEASVGWLTELQSILSAMPQWDGSVGQQSTEPMEPANLGMRRTDKSLAAVGNDDASEKEEQCNLDPMAQVLALFSAIVTPPEVPALHPKESSPAAEGTQKLEGGAWAVEGKKLTGESALAIGDDSAKGVTVGGNAGDQILRTGSIETNGTGHQEPENESGAGENVPASVAIDGNAPQGLVASQILPGVLDKAASEKSGKQEAQSKGGQLQASNLIGIEDGPSTETAARANRVPDVNSDEHSFSPETDTVELVDPHISLDLRARPDLGKKPNAGRPGTEMETISAPENKTGIEAGKQLLERKEDHGRQDNPTFQEKQAQSTPAHAQELPVQMSEGTMVTSTEAGQQDPKVGPMPPEKAQVPAENSASPVDRVKQMEQSMKPKEPRVVSIRIPLVDGEGASKHLDLVFRNRGEDLSLKMAIQGDTAQQQLSSELPSLLKKLETIDWHTAQPAHLENVSTTREASFNSFASRGEFGNSIALNSASSPDAGTSDSANNSQDEAFQGGGQSQNPQEQERRRNAGRSNNWRELLQAEFSE